MRMTATVTGDSDIAAIKIATHEPVRCMIEFERSHCKLMFTVGHDGAVGLTWDPDTEPSHLVVWQIGQLVFVDPESDDPHFEVKIPTRQP